jgi:hypothetical protein
MEQRIVGKENPLTREEDPVKDSIQRQVQKLSKYGPQGNRLQDKMWSTAKGWDSSDMQLLKVVWELQGWLF